MAIVTLSQFDKGIDCVIKWDTNILKQLFAKKHKFVARYINGTVSSSKPNGKCITKDEMNRILNVGLGVILIFEKSVDRAVPGTVAQATKNGLQDALEAAKDIAFLGYPTNAPVIVAAGDTDIISVDFGKTKANLSQAVAYFTAFKNNIANPCGVYGDYDLIDALKTQAAILWQANAPGWSFDNHPSAHVLQTRTYNRYDGNIVLRPIDMYSINTTFSSPDTAIFQTFNPSVGAFEKYPYILKKGTLRYGSKGDAVSYLQGALKIILANETLYFRPNKTAFKGSDIVVSGNFDNNTLLAVKYFQNLYRKVTFDGLPSQYLTVNGKVSYQTWGALDNIIMNM